MSSPFTKDVKNAAIIGDLFSNRQVLATSVTFANTASSTATITHGLSAAPTFVLYSTNDANPALLGYTANTTSIVFTRTATTTSGAARIDVIAAVKG